MKDKWLEVDLSEGLDILMGGKKRSAKLNGKFIVKKYEPIEFLRTLIREYLEPEDVTIHVIECSHGYAWGSTPGVGDQ